jgi:hypothetical protein
MNPTILCLFAILAIGTATASAQSMAEHLPLTDAEKIAVALRAAPSFMTDGATIMDHPASKGAEFRVLRKGTSEWTCLPGPPLGSAWVPPRHVTVRFNFGADAASQVRQLAAVNAVLQRCGIGKTYLVATSGKT